MVWSGEGSGAAGEIGLPASGAAREDILLFVKEIDNAGVERVADSKETLANVGMAGGVLATSVLVIALLLPGTYSLVVSHRIEEMKQNREQLVNTLRSMRAERARLESPAQVEQWAATEFVAPVRRPWCMRLLAARPWRDWGRAADRAARDGDRRGAAAGMAVERSQQMRRSSRWQSMWRKSRRAGRYGSPG